MDFMRMVCVPGWRWLKKSAASDRHGLNLTLLHTAKLPNDRRRIIA